MKRKKNSDKSEGIIRICSHNIEWCLNGVGLSLTGIDEEHICNMLIENCIQGDLCSIAPNGNEVWGWWSIQD